MSVIKQGIIWVLIVLLPTMVLAQEGGNNASGHNARVVMDPVFKIKLKPNKTVIYSFQSKEDYDHGIYDENATTVEVDANMDWQITITAGSQYFEGKAGNQLSPKVFNYAKSGETLQSLSYDGNPTPVATGGPGKKKDEGNTFTVDYFIDPGYKAPDEYEIEIIYTISAK